MSQQLKELLGHSVSELFRLDLGVKQSFRRKAGTVALILNGSLNDFGQMMLQLQLAQKKNANKNSFSFKSELFK